MCTCKFICFFFFLSSSSTFLRTWRHLCGEVREPLGVRKLFMYISCSWLSPVIIWWAQWSWRRQKRLGLRIRSPLASVSAVLLAVRSALRKKRKKKRQGCEWYWKDCVHLLCVKVGRKFWVVIKGLKNIVGNKDCWLAFTWLQLHLHCRQLD